MSVALVALCHLLEINKFGEEIRRNPIIGAETIGMVVGFRLHKFTGIYVGNGERLNH